MKLVLIEGLSAVPPFYASYLQRQLVPQLSKVDVEVYGWNRPIELSEGPYVVVTHSFGWTAIKKLAIPGVAPLFASLSLMQNIKAIITIDPRSWTCDFGGAASFKAPISHTYNFYQKSWFSLPGYPVAGAANVKLTGYSHGTICAAPNIVALIKSLL